MDERSGSIRGSPQAVPETLNADVHDKVEIALCSSRNGSRALSGDLPVIPVKGLHCVPLNEGHYPKPDNSGTAFILSMDGCSQQGESNPKLDQLHGRPVLNQHSYEDNVINTYNLDPIGSYPGLFTFGASGKSERERERERVREKE